jgi:hypothetical protein
MGVWVQTAFVCVLAVAMCDSDWLVALLGAGSACVLVAAGELQCIRAAWVASQEHTVAGRGPTTYGQARPAERLLYVAGSSVACWGLCRLYSTALRFAHQNHPRAYEGVRVAACLAGLLLALMVAALLVALSGMRRRLVE